MPINVIPSRKFVVTIELNSTRRKVLQLIIDNKPSVIVSWPYYKKPDGLLSTLTIPPGRGKHTLSLKPAGKLTSYNVKYSHHSDGEVHFSQDGKIFTRIRKKSVELINYNGHLFTSQFQGLKDFDEAAATGDNNHASPSRSVINFKVLKDEPSAIKILGFWKPISSLRPPIGFTDVGPQAVFQTSDGVNHQGFILAPLEFSKATHVLLLTCEEIPQLDKSRYSCFTLIGGFDKPEVANNSKVSTTFLAANYPADHPEELIKEIGTIDFVV